MEFRFKITTRNANNYGTFGRVYLCNHQLRNFFRLGSTPPAKWRLVLSTATPRNPRGVYEISWRVDLWGTTLLHYLRRDGVWELLPGLMNATENQIKVVRRPDDPASFYAWLESA